MDDDSYIDIYYVDFINRCFRDVADKDYVAARILGRQRLGHQFMWSGLQAMEKYLKAILLFSRESTKGLSHDLKKILHHVENQITDIAFDLPDDVRDFISILGRYGANRYFEYTHATYGKELLALDRAVWHVRRYCQNLRSISLPGGESPNVLASNLQTLATYDPNCPWTASLQGGYLEKLLADRDETNRKHLVWKNFYFGANKKRKIKWQVEVSIQTPTHELYPQLFTVLDRLVHFSPEVRKDFQSMLKLGGGQ